MKKKYKYNLMTGGILTVTMLLLILISVFYVPYDPDKMDSTAKLAKASFHHIMGCDQFGRDIFSRVMKGCGNTFFVAAGTVLMGTVFGILIGSFTGYYGGILDEVLMRINDTIFAFPSILLALVFVSLLGGGKYQIILALGIAFIPSFARIVRSEFIRCRELDYGMSFLGIGVQPPEASLGRMMSEAQTYLLTRPSMALFPGLMILWMVLGFALLGEGISERQTG